MFWQFGAGYCITKSKRENCTNILCWVYRFRKLKINMGNGIINLDFQKYYKGFGIKKNRFDQNRAFNDASFSKVLTLENRKPTYFVIFGVMIFLAVQYPKQHLHFKFVYPYNKLYFQTG